MISLQFEHDVDFEEVLERLAKTGWEFVREENSLWYMTDFDWKELPLDGLTQAKLDMRAAYEAGETTGMTVRLPGGEFYANVMFHEDRRSVSLIPLLDYRTIERSPEFVDLGWYLENFRRPFRDFTILSTEASDHR
ncbi:hypothetical protein [Nonomuraea coxensis]|nr:hypothetical protein [Nonomuraea coxensis]